MTRGLVLPLTLQQTVNRALYLAGEVDRSALDEHVREPLPWCATGYYRLAYPNGGEDPSAPDPFARWSEPGKTFVNVTGDCVAGASWCGGWDRKQPVRFAHLYDGSINTNSMLMDARGPRICFRTFDYPQPGAMVVCASGTPGHKVGHVGTIVGYKLAEWDPTIRACWEAIEVVDIAGRAGRANRRTTGIGWRGTGAMFVRSIMQP
jgi:hypothetical protein